MRARREPTRTRRRTRSRAALRLPQVTWVTVIGPLVLIALLLWHCVELEGASEGIAFYLGKFDHNTLLDLEL